MKEKREYSISQEEKLENLTEIFKKHEAILHEKEKKIFNLKYILEDVPGSIYCKDLNGVYFYRNNTSAQSMRGFKFPWEWEKIIGKTDHDLFSKEMADKFQENDRYVIETGKELVKEEVAILPSGRKVVQLSRKKPLLDRNGNIIGVIGSTVDITYLKEIENELRTEKDKAEAANKAKTEFLQNMRHDIRTPLGGIVGFLEILRDEKDLEKIRRYTHMLAEAGHELLRFLNDILESVNVGSGDIPLLKKKFDLTKIFENVIKLQQPKANEKNLKLHVSFDRNIPRYLISDPIRIYRILLELVVNALKFTDHGSVSINAKLAKKNEREVVIKIEVEDTGSGIPIEKQQEIFLRFKRLTPSYEGIYKGAGLGLSIVKQFIDDLGGEIYHEKSSTNTGAKFVCVIPVKESLIDDNSGVDTNTEKCFLI